MKKILALFLLLPQISYALSSSAPNAILMDASTGEVLYEKNADEPIQPASITKLMTLYILFEDLRSGRFTMDTKFKVGENSWRQTGSRMFLDPNEEVEISKLIRGLAIHSGNDAAVAVAEGVEGSIDKFAARMNETAKKLGMRNSEFGNPSGRFHERQKMSVRDMAILSYRIMNDFPEYYPIFSEASFTHNKITQKNRNPLLKTDMGADGLKTGYLPEVGYMLAASAKQGETRFILAAGRYKTIPERAKDTSALMRTAFRDYSSNYLAQKGVSAANIKVAVGVQDSVEGVVSESIKMTLPSSSWGRIKAYAAYQEPLIAPIKAGQQIGNLHLRVPNKEEIIIPLLAKNDVMEKPTIEKAQDNWASWADSLMPKSSE